jgi:hypothetical protein
VIQSDLFMPKRSLLVACVLYLTATLIFLYPLPFHLSDRIFENGDSYLNLWIFSWEQYSLRHSPREFFNGNIFFPEANTLALSELMLPVMPIFAALLFPTQNPLVAYNATLLLTFPLSALSMFALVYYLTRRSSAATIAGFIFGFTPIRLSHLHHIQLESLMWLPLLFLFHYRWLELRRWRDAFAVGLLFAIQYLTTVYIALYLVPVLTISYLLHFAFRKQLPDKTILSQAIAAAVVATTVLIPFILPYQRLAQWNIQPTESLKISFSSDLWRNLFAVFPTNFLYGNPFRSVSVPPFERFYFTGFLPIGLAAFAIGYRRRHVLRFFAVIAVAAYAVALGPFLQISGHVTGIPLPYRWLLDHLPGFSMLRVPARAGIITFAAFTVICAFGWLQFWEWVSKRITLRESMAAALVIVVLGAEFCSVPIPLFAEVSGSDIPQVYSFLRDYPDEGGVLEIPAFGRAPDGTEFWERVYTYFSAYHYKPIVIGYSGYNPPEFHELIAASVELPKDSPLDIFEAIGVRSIILHTRKLTKTQMEEWQAAIDTGRRLQRVVAYPDGSQLLAIQPSLKLSQDLNDLAWTVECAPAQSRGNATIKLKSELRSGKFDYVVNPQLPRFPDRPHSRVHATSAEFQWWDDRSQIVMQGRLNVRLPYVLNNSSVEANVEAPARPGKYSLHFKLLESPPVALATTAVVN